MTTTQIRLWATRTTSLLAAVYFSVSSYADHQSFSRLLGGLGIAYIFVWLGGEIERNTASKEPALLTEDQRLNLAITWFSEEADVERAMHLIGDVESAVLGNQPQPERRST